MHHPTKTPLRRSILALAAMLALFFGAAADAVLAEEPALEPESPTQTAADDGSDHEHETGESHDTGGPPENAGGSQHDAGDPPGHDTGSHEDSGETHDTGDDSGHDSSHGANAPQKLACSDIDPTWNEILLKGHPLSGHYQVGDAHRSVELFLYDAPAGGKLVNWNSSGPIAAVILRSGQDAATYEYDPPTTGASGLQPPLVDRDGRNLAAVVACYEPEAVDVGIDLYLIDSTDPVDVDTPFSYLIEVTASPALWGSEVVLTLAQGVVALGAGDCTIDGQLVRCSPPLDEVAQWSMAIEVEATEAGSIVSWVELVAQTDEGPISVSALEVTRIVGSPGKGGGCGGHEDGHDTSHDTSHETSHDTGASGSDHDEGECGADRHGLIAACTAIDPAAETILLKGPFASRRYQLSGPGDTVIWVEVGETTGAQMATWQSSVPVDAVIARTGKQLEIYQSRPAALEGTGVVGPMSGSGPRPMADIAFCVVVPPAVDVVPARTESNPPPTVIYDTVVPPFDPPRLDPPPVVLSADLEAEAETGADETEVAPPAAVTPELTALPFTGTPTLGLLASLGAGMLVAGGLLIGVVALFDQRSRGAHTRRRENRVAT